jgi:predicted XRE-type DNA-binding protein
LGACGPTSFPLLQGGMATKARRKKRKTTTPRAKRSTLRRDAIPRSLLVREVQRQIDRFGLTREAAGVVVGDAATQMSRLMTGHFRDFSVDRLAKMLIRLGSDVTISIKHSPKLGRRGKIRIKSG